MKMEFDIQDRYKQLKVIIQNHTLNDEVQNIMERLKSKQQMKSLLGYEHEKTIIMKPEDIYLFYAGQGKVMAVLHEKEYQMKDKLYRLEESLANDGFVRISKSAIVNLNHIANIEATFDGSLVVTMKNKAHEIISRRCVKKVKEALGL